MSTLSSESSSVQEKKESQSMEIARQTEDFIARGGKITKLSSAVSGGVVIDDMAGQSIPEASRRVEGGIPVMTAEAVRHSVRLSDIEISKMVMYGTFPAPMRRRPERLWREQDIIRWLSRGGVSS
ncbi:MAG: hypothetical protein ACK5MR_13210 [Cumulibacter sp.]